MAESFIQTQKRHALTAWDDLFQRPMGNLLTLMVLAVALSLPATFYLLAKNVVAVSEQWHSPAEINVFLTPVQSKQHGQDLADKLSAWPNIDSVEYVSPSEGMTALKTQRGFNQAISLLDDNPLPSVIVVVPTTDTEEGESALSLSARAEALAEQLSALDAVDEVRLDTDWLARLDAIKTLALTLAWLFSCLMLAAVVLLVGNTLRLQVLHHQPRIQVMKMVGATDSFILRPYLYMGVWLGSLAAIVAWILTALNTWLMDGAVRQFAQLYDSPFTLRGLNWDESLLLLMGSTLLGVLAALLATRRHLKEIEPV
ncbi:permease-like cell division protein FtsX [Salinivibrio sp. ES.052]|uniref:permease-like cell division protein FtsX n=1 Tax=Salinivibrio sp. ES.052 TaxID=1882823 RepID=UPI0009276D69|nr:permease-like cell division protein FtsX [Salinivibrio sp. ES.052]SIO20653.1 cell division protein FtsX [Salinivibrio sp. ES.052]